MMWISAQNWVPALSRKVISSLGWSTWRRRNVSRYGIICPTADRSQSDQDVFDYCDDVYRDVAAVSAGSPRDGVRQSRWRVVGSRRTRDDRLLQLLCQPHRLRAHVETFPRSVHPGDETHFSSWSTPVASPAMWHWGTYPPSTSNNFIFSWLWSKSESQLSKYCVVCEISWCRCQQLTALSISTALVTKLLVIEQLLQPAPKSTVSAPWHNLNLRPSSQQMLATSLINSK